MLSTFIITFLIAALATAIIYGLLTLISLTYDMRRPRRDLRIRIASLRRAAAARLRTPCRYCGN
jgi:hypothetical protein